MKKIKLSCVLFLISIILFSCKGTPSRKPSGDNSGSGGSGGSTPSSSDTALFDATKLFVEVENGKPVTLDLTNGPTDKYDIYVMYTSETADASGSGSIETDNLPRFNANVSYKGAYDTPTPKSNVGDKTKLYRTKYLEGGDEKLIEVDATLKHVRTVSTKNGNRTLEIWEEDGMTAGQIPTQAEYEVIANCFLKDGLDNDIYDILTNYCGSDEGWLIGSAGESRLIDFNGIITLFYCDIGGEGKQPEDNEWYKAGFYHEMHNAKNNAGLFADDDKSNARSMIFLNAYTSGGDKYLGNNILTLAHEFQHLLHAQYFNLDRFSNSLKKNESISEKVNDDREKEKYRYSYSIDECFSSMVEEYLAEFVMNTTGKEAKDPFYVTMNKNANGFITEATGKALKNSMASSYLKYYQSFSLDGWREGEDDDAYGIVAAFAHYLLCNYGMDIIRAYRENSQKTGNLDGIVVAINDMNNDNKMTRGKLLQNWGIATLLSRQEKLSKPYSFNNKGWISVSDKRIPSVNMWLYEGANNAKGFPDIIPGGDYFRYGTNIFERIQKDFQKGVFTKSAVTFSEGFSRNCIMTIIAVPVK